MERKSIGTFIAALRRANGMTQQELADKLCVSNKAVSRWERDETLPDLTLIPAIAEIFGVTCDEILRGEPKAPSDAGVSDGGELPQARENRAAERGERRAAAIVTRELSKFRMLTAVAAALAVVGPAVMYLIGMFFQGGVTVIGMLVMAIIDVIAAVIEAIAIIRLRGSCGDELTEDAEKTMVKLSYAVFAAIVIIATAAVSTGRLSMTTLAVDMLSSGAASNALIYVSGAIMPPVLCAAAFYLCYGPYSRRLTHKNAPAPVCGGVGRFRIFCAAVTVLMAAADVTRKLLFAMNVASAPDVPGRVINIITVVCLLAITAACVVFFVGNSARGRRAAVLSEASRGLLFSVGAGLLFGSIGVSRFTDEKTSRISAVLNTGSLLAGALLVAVTAVITTAIIRRYRRAEEEKEAKNAEKAE